MDIWEANSISSAYTAHPCSIDGLHKCSSPTECGDNPDNRYNGVCDKDGCDLNPYRTQVEDFYGPGKTIDTGKPFSVVTQFLTDEAGDLREIRRKFVQGGKVYDQPKTAIDGLHDIQYDSVSDQMCSDVKAVFQDKDDFSAKGGLAKMGQAMKNGMVLVLSMWDDHEANMLWLDSIYPTDRTAKGSGGPRGTCPTTGGVPAQVEKDHPDATVKFSDIRVGDIDSTYKDLLYEQEDFLQ